MLLWQPFEMDVDGVVVVVEVNGRNNMELGIKYIEENIEDILDGPHKFLANLIAKIGFGVELANVPKERVCPIIFRWIWIILKF